LPAGANAGSVGCETVAIEGACPALGSPPTEASARLEPTLPALAPAGKTPLKMLVRAAVAVVERHYVESALAITEGNRTAAAERLGLSRQSLYAKLSRYGLDAAKR
jgi:DNA-binding NtrC family response regulator